MANFLFFVNKFKLEFVVIQKDKQPEKKSPSKKDE